MHYMQVNGQSIITLFGCCDMHTHFNRKCTTNREIVPFCTLDLLQIRNEFSTKSARTKTHGSPNGRVHVSFESESERDATEREREHVRPLINYSSIHHWSITNLWINRKLFGVGRVGRIERVLGQKTATVIHFISLIYFYIRQSILSIYFLGHLFRWVSMCAPSSYRQHVQRQWLRN